MAPVADPAPKNAGAPSVIMTSGAAEKTVEKFEWAPAAVFLKIGARLDTLRSRAQVRAFVVMGGTEKPRRAVAGVRRSRSATVDVARVEPVSARMRYTTEARVDHERDTGKVSTMAHITYEVVEHDGGWAYRVGGVFSEAFSTRALAHAAASRAAREQRISGDTHAISYEDSSGKWHEETSKGDDRPVTDVEG